MDETNEELILCEETQKNARYERNRKYYLKNTDANLRSTLLHNVKSSGRIPALKTLEKHKILVEDLVKNWRMYKESVGVDGIPPLKRMKFQVLISNLV